ncbi:Striatin-4 [Heterocephalus glaber]|uniref:Striatin-4 n=1 Tax=Heterocephalus glaber TaxID=10181 RepID=G5ATV9_HETGA|nr:Striatin-4 [Heterocephalus glaber]
MAGGSPLETSGTRQEAILGEGSALQCCAAMEVVTQGHREEAAQQDKHEPTEDDNSEPQGGQKPRGTSRIWWRYLEEVGYTDTILDMRSKRVRSLLGRSLELNGATEFSERAPRGAPSPGGLSGGESLLVKRTEEQIKRNAAGKDGKERLGSSVLEQIPFLQTCEDEDSDEDDELDSVQHKEQRVKLPSKALVPEMEDEDEDEEDDSEDAINEFDLLGSGEDGEGSPGPRRCTSEGTPPRAGEPSGQTPGNSGRPSGHRWAAAQSDGPTSRLSPAPAPLRRFHHGHYRGRGASEHGVLTSVAFTSNKPAHIVASFRSGDTILYDLETGSALLTLESRGSSGLTQINQVVSHPNQSLTITAHDDRGIHFLDNWTGKSVCSMVAHLDAVTCLAVDPNGVFLMSGSHDCSLHLWSLDNKMCVQEITAHCKKHEEAIHAVASTQQGPHRQCWRRCPGQGLRMMPTWPRPGQHTG